MVPRPAGFASPARSTREEDRLGTIAVILVLVLGATLPIKPDRVGSHLGETRDSTRPGRGEASPSTRFSDRILSASPANPFRADRVVNRTSAVVTGNTSRLVSVNRSYAAREVAVTMSPANETYQLVPDWTDTGGRAAWTAANASDVTYWQPPQGPARNALAVNCTGKRGVVTVTPYNATVGTEYFWDQNGWQFRPDTPATISLNPNGYFEQGQTQCVEFLLSANSNHPEVQSVTKSFVYEHTGTPRDVTLSFYYQLYKTSNVQTTLRVYLVDADGTSHHVDAWTTTADTNFQWVSHSFENASLNAFFTKSGTYNVTFEVTHLVPTSEPLGVSRLFLDHVRLELDQPSTRFPAGAFYSWNATLPLLAPPVADNVTLTWAYAVPALPAGANASTSTVGVEVNGTWFPERNLTEVNPETTYLANLSVPATIFGEAACLIKIGVHTGLDAWLVRPNETLGVVVYNLSSAFVIQRPVESLAPALQVNDADWSLAGANLSTGAAWTNLNFTTWAFGETLTVAVGFAASRPFAVVVNVSVTLVSWREVVLACFDSVSSAWEGYLDQLSALGTTSFSASWDKATVGTVLADLIPASSTGDLTPAARLGPRAIPCFQGLHGAMERYFAFDGHAHVPSTPNQTLAGADQLLRGFLDASLAGTTPGTFFTSQLAPLRSTLQGARSSLLITLNANLTRAGMLDINRLLETFLHLQVQLGELAANARLTMELPAADSQSAMGTIYHGNSLQVYNACLNNPRVPLLPVAWARDPATNTTFLQSPAFFPLPATTLDAPTGGIYLASEVDADLLGGIASILFVLERTSWATFPGRLVEVVRTAVRQPAVVPAVNVSTRTTTTSPATTANATTNSTTTTGSVTCYLRYASNRTLAAPHILSRVHVITPAGPRVLASTLHVDPALDSFPDPGGGAPNLTLPLVVPDPALVIAAINPPATSGSSPETPLAAPLLVATDVYHAGYWLNATATHAAFPWAGTPPGPGAPRAAQGSGPHLTTVTHLLAAPDAAWDWTPPGLPPAHVTTVSLVSADPTVDLWVNTSAGVQVGSRPPSRAIPAGQLGTTYRSPHGFVETVTVVNQSLQSVTIHQAGGHAPRAVTLVVSRANLTAPLVFLPRYLDQTLYPLKTGPASRVYFPACELSGFPGLGPLHLEIVTATPISTSTWDSLSPSDGHLPAVLAPGHLVACNLTLPHAGATPGTIAGRLQVNVSRGDVPEPGNLHEMVVTVAVVVVEIRNPIEPSGILGFLVLFTTIIGLVFFLRAYKRWYFSKLHVR